MTQTPWAVRREGVTLLRDHDVAPEGERDWHDWVIVPGYEGAPVTVSRDWLGRGLRSSQIGYAWLIVRCNNSACDAAAAVRLESIELDVQRLIPVPVREVADV